MFINAITLSFTILTCMSIRQDENEVNPTRYTQLIHHFSQLYNNRFVILISPDNKTDERLSNLISIRNFFSRSLTLYTSIFDFFTFFRLFKQGSYVNFGMTAVFVHFDHIRIPELNTMLKARYNGLMTWLCEIPSNESISKLKDVFAPLDSKFFLINWVEDNRAEILELYNIPRSDTQEVRYLGGWDEENGLTITEKDWAKRRENLKGVTLKYFTLNRAPIACNREFFRKNYPAVFRCLTGKVWKSFGQRFNFTTKHYYFKNPDGYKLVMDVLTKGICDAGQVLLYMRPSQRVYYLWPRIVSRFVVFTAATGSEIQMSTYLKPCSNTFWIVLALWLTFAGIILALLVSVVGRLVYHKKSIFDHIADFYVPFQAICLQGSTLTASLIGIKIALFMCYIVPVFFLTAYSGQITSSLTHPTRFPFQTMHEFERNGQYKLEAVKNYFALTLLKNDKLFEKSRKLSLISKKMPTTSAEAFKNICTKKVSLVSSDYSFSVTPPLCKVYSLKNIVGDYFASMALSPHFPFREPMNRYIQKIISVGLGLEEFRKGALNDFDTVISIMRRDMNRRHSFETSLEPASLENLMALFAILVVGIVLSILLLILELLHKKMGKKE